MSQDLDEPMLDELEASILAGTAPPIEGRYRRIRLNQGSGKVDTVPD